MTGDTLRVLQVHNRYRQLGGEDAVVASEAEILRRGGHDVVEHVVTNPSDDIASAASLAAAPWNPISARSIRRVARETEPSVAHVHNTWFTLSPSVLGALHKSNVPVVLTLHNYRLVCLNGLLFRDGAPCRDCVGGSPLPGIRHRCYRGSTIPSVAAAATISFNRARNTWLHGVDRFIAPSQGLRDLLVTGGGLPEERVVVRPHTVADVGPRSRPASASSTVLYAGRISEEKGLGVLLEAWRRARPAGLELVVAGDGPLRAEHERLAIPGVRFVGWLEPAAVRELMLTSRALAFPSVCYESFGSTIIEAMSARLPVIASAHGAPAEIVGEVGAEWLAAPGDAAAWAERLGILGDDRAIDAAADRGREIYASRYAPERGLASLVDIYRSAIECAARRRGSR
jgi:glycosyltransferase involved in cell wall biosynthesis